MHLPEKFLDRMRDLLEEEFPAFFGKLPSAPAVWPESQLPEDHAGGI